MLGRSFGEGIERVGTSCLRATAPADSDIESEALHFLDQYVERLRRSRFEDIIAFDDRLVDSGSALHVVRLNGKQLLQSVSGAVSFERPHFHLTEALAAILRLTTQRLLGDQ